VSTPLNVVAYGSNSNGSWVRFAGGLQVCWVASIASQPTTNKIGDIYYSNPQGFGFPAVFANTPLVAPCGHWDGTATAIAFGIVRSVSSTEVQMHCMSGLSTAGGVNGYIAVGTWV